MNDIQKRAINNLIREYKESLKDIESEIAIQYKRVEKEECNLKGLQDNYDSIEEDIKKLRLGEEEKK